MIRGIGDPLVIAYARCYLVRVGIAIGANNEVYIRECFSDFLSIYHTVSNFSVPLKIINSHKTFFRFQIQA